jgi:hypothetical protein
MQIGEEEGTARPRGILTTMRIIGRGDRRKTDQMTRINDAIATETTNEAAEGNALEVKIGVGETKETARETVPRVGIGETGEAVGETVLGAETEQMVGRTTIETTGNEQRGRKRKNGIRRTGTGPKTNAVSREPVHKTEATILHKPQELSVPRPEARTPLSFRGSTMAQDHKVPDLSRLARQSQSSPRKSPISFRANSQHKALLHTDRLSALRREVPGWRLITMGTKDNRF